MGRLTLGLCVVLFASANALYPLIPEGKELIYNYRGWVRANAESPVPYGSSFFLEGNLHLQTDKNSSFIHFTDLKYKLYNGELSEWNEADAKEMPLPKEFEAFQNTFKVVYEPCGHAWGIAVEKDEPQYVINMKRGIASFMQMYTEKLDWSKKIPYAFHAKEHTLYGKGPHYYTVFPGSDEWTVKKMIEPHSSYHMYSHLSTAAEMHKCDAKFDEPLARTSNQIYHIIQKNGAYVMDFIESMAGIAYMPYGGEGYTFYLGMNQTMHLDKIIDATPITIKSEKFYHGLNFYTADFSDMLSIGDLMNGRRTYDMDKMLGELEEMLYDTIKYMNEYHLDMKAPDWTRGELVNRMFHLMVQLDEAHLEKMTAILAKKTSDEDKEALYIYYHMLPMIGSNHSFKYMLKLIKTKQVKDKIAREWLETMPMYAKTPNKMLIESMSEMLNWGEELSMDVRKSAILAFGTFIDKAIFRYKKLNHINYWTGHEDHHNEENFTPDLELDEFFPGPKFYEKYVVMLGEKLNAAKSHGWRSVFISALYNTRMEKAIHYLWPIARGELFEDDHYLRFLSVISLGGLTMKSDELTYEVFWPLMSDYSLNTNIRVFAFYQIMKTHPSIYRLTSMMWQMFAEPNHAFYQFYYSYIETLMHSSDPCMEHIKKSIKQIFAYLPRPEYYGMTRYVEYNYYDDKYEFGQQFETILIHSGIESETTMKIKMSRTIDNAKFEQWGFLVHVDGLEASIFDDVMLYMKDSNKMLNFEKVWKAYQNIYNNKHIDLDIGITLNGQVIKMLHFDASNIKELQTTFAELFIGDKFNYVKKFFSINYNAQTIAVMPTDIGFPAMFKNTIPTIYLFDIKFTKEMVNNMFTWQSDIHCKQFTQGGISLSFYNPIIDMYQGVHKAMSFYWQQPFYFDLSFNPTQQSMKLSWKRHDDSKEDIFGYKTYSAMFTFFRDDFKTGLLQQLSPKSKDWEMVTFGDEHRDTHVLFEEDSSNTGFHHVIAQFDSDKWAKNTSMFHDNFHMSKDSRSWISQWFLDHYQKLVYDYIQPYPYANGVLHRYEVSQQYPVTNIDMNIRFTRDYKRGDLMLFPGTKWNMRATYSIKNKDITLKTWDANLILDSDMGHTTTGFKAILSRLIPGQKELRMCVDGTRKYTANGIESEATVALTHSMEPKCTKDEKIMEIKVKAEKSWEQKEAKHIYGECEDPLWSDLNGMRSLACFYARDTYRKWTYDFKTFNMPTEFKKYVYGIFNWSKVKYMDYLTKIGESSGIEENTWKIITQYPVIGKKVDMFVYTPETRYAFGGIPSSLFPMYNYHMMSTRHYSPMFGFMHKMGWSETCQVHQEFYYNATDDHINYIMPQEWTMYLGNAETDAHHGIWLKKLDDHKTAMKMMHGEHTLEIVPTGKMEYDFIVDGQKLPPHTYQYEHQWFWMDMIKESGIVSVFCMHTGNFMAFDGHHLLVEYPNRDVPFYGKCA